MVGQAIRSSVLTWVCLIGPAGLGLLDWVYLVGNVSLMWLVGSTGIGILGIKLGL